MTELVRYEVADAVALITLNRPERLNAWTPPLQVAYFGALGRATDDPAVGAIVVTGAGRGFCAGADTEYLKEIRAASAAHAHPDPPDFPLSVPKLTIAAINGACAGVGLLQALQCDIRFVAASAKITTSFARRGLIAEHGMAWLLERTVGLSHASDLLLSGRVIDGVEAAALGLASASCECGDLLARALAYGREVAAGCAPSSVACIKRQLREASGQSREAAYARSQELMKISHGGPDFAEGVASFLDRRPAAFAPLGHGTKYPVE